MRIAAAFDNYGYAGQVKGDGDPTCFTKVDDTGIPALQEWCHNLTISSRSRAARSFLTHLTTFAKNVRMFLQGIGDVTEEDRLAMKDLWESDVAEGPDVYQGFASSDPGFDMDDPFTGLHTIKQSKIGPDGKPIGVTPRLVEVRHRQVWLCSWGLKWRVIQEFGKVVDDCVQDLQERFRDGLEERCQVGATNVS